MDALHPCVHELTNYATGQPPLFKQTTHSTQNITGCTKFHGTRVQGFCHLLAEGSRFASGNSSPVNQGGLQAKNGWRALLQALRTTRTITGLIQVSTPCLKRLGDVAGCATRATRQNREHRGMSPPPLCPEARACTTLEQGRQGRQGCPGRLRAHAGLEPMPV